MTPATTLVPSWTRGDSCNGLMSRSPFGSMTGTRAGAHVVTREDASGAASDTAGGGARGVSAYAPIDAPSAGNFSDRDEPRSAEALWRWLPPLPGTRKGATPRAGRKSTPGGLDRCPPWPNALAVPRTRSPQLELVPVFADLHGSSEVRGPAETVRGRRDLRDVAGPRAGGTDCDPACLPPCGGEGGSWEACWPDSSGMRCSLQRVRPSAAEASRRARNPAPGDVAGLGQPGRLPSRQAAGAAKRFGPSCARGFAAALSPPLFRTRNGARRTC